LTKYPQPKQARKGRAEEKTGSGTERQANKRGGGEVMRPREKKPFARGYAEAKGTNQERGSDAEGGTAKKTLRTLKAGHERDGAPAPMPQEQPEGNSCPKGAGGKRGDVLGGPASNNVPAGRFAAEQAKSRQRSGG